MNGGYRERGTKRMRKKQEKKIDSKKKGNGSAFYNF